MRNQRPIGEAPMLATIATIAASVPETALLFVNFMLDRYHNLKTI